MSDDKFILIGLDDSRSKEISEILGNKTCKKILDFLAERSEASEKDISSALSIPINTAEYNLNKLIKAGLVEKAKNFFWSVKGKKIDMYKLAKKHIVISPKSSKIDMVKLKSVLPVIGVAAILIFAVLFVAFYSNGKIPVTTNSSIDGPKQFSSIEELKTFLSASSQDESNGYYGTGAERMLDAPVAEGMAKDSAQTTSLGGAGSSANSHSETNIQVEGVDEADIVKNDGKYIYTLSGNKVSIVDAYPAENMNVLSSINVSQASNIFINKDELVIFSSSYRHSQDNSLNSKVACYGYRCGGYSKSFTDIYIYDVTDHKNPVLSKNISVEGNYQDSRMIKDSVYLISSQYVYSSDPVLPLYSIDGVEKSVELSDMYYFDYSDTSYVFNTISSFNVNGDDFKSKVYLTGGTGNVYVSENNIYMTYTKTFDYRTYAKSFSEEVALKLLPDSEKEKVEAVMSSKNPYYSQLSQVRKIIFDYSLTLSGSDKEEFDSRYLELSNEFEKNMNKRTQKTVINKVGISEGNIEYLGLGEVPGQVLNQFSMDEYKENFRIATTSGQTFESGSSSNNLYVLDSEMRNIGSLEDLAPGEKIYSARFMQDRAYIVTFKSVDPLFVIDLSKPEKPQVLGYLKIPGYSDYLQPYDETHLIGIGKDVNESIDADKVHSEGAVYYTAILGLKVSMFDVSDFENPREVSKVIIGERGTDSPALYDHKAVLFDREKGILVLPVSLTKLVNVSYGGGRPYEESQQIWQGAYVFNVKPDEISIRGRISHNNETDSKKLSPAKDESIGAIRKDASGNSWTKFNVLNGISQWRTTAAGFEGVVYSDYEIDSFPGGVNYRPYFDYSTQIQRSLYMDNTLYTVSNALIKANNLNDLSEVNSVDLGYANEVYYGYYGKGMSPAIAID